MKTNVCVLAVPSIRQRPASFLVFTSNAVRLLLVAFWIAASFGADITSETAEIARDTLVPALKSIGPDRKVWTKTGVMQAPVQESREGSMEPVADESIVEIETGMNY